MKSKLSVVAILFVICLWSSTAQTPVFVAQLTNEGARSNFGPNAFPNKPWEFGAEEITAIGLRQQYLVGYDLKYNYGSTLKLNEVYSPWQIYVRSTNHNVTLMSAQSQIEALFPLDKRADLTANQAKIAVPPGDNTIIQDDITNLGNKIMPNNFQTVPIHAMDFDKDSVLSHNWCSNIYLQNRKSVNNTNWETEMNKNFTTSLTAFRKFMKNDAMTIHQIYPYIDGVYALKFNLTSIDELDSQIDELMKFRFTYLERFWSNSNSLSLYANGFIVELLRYMSDAKTQFENTQLADYNRFKLSMYFGTTESIYAISKYLGYVHTKYPDFASQFLIKLEQNPDRKYNVTMYYNKNIVKIGGECGNVDSCDLDLFTKFLQSKKAQDSHLKECEPELNSPLMMFELIPESDNNTLIIGIAAVSVLILVTAIVCIMWFKKSKKSPFARLEDHESLIRENIII